ncbi:MAG: glucosaminidase domain-containing protein [Bacteroidales bacterium]|nr:glucosaminidase domain-containing protein [Bacteroidales bacterium]MCF8333467.1 glucosaminidase domain-containing protein [Bacteroidales bacterium]
MNYSLLKSHFPYIFLLIVAAFFTLIFEGCVEDKDNSPNSTQSPKKEKKDSVKQKPTAKQIAGDLPDFSVYEDSKEKKKVFFDFLRPIVKFENNKVMEERDFILEKYQQVKSSDSLTNKDKSKLLSLAMKYRVKSKVKFDENFFRKLLIKADKIPVELALVQAANESAWGTSYFARKGNNLFGQWCFKPGCGIVPRKRSEGSTHEVAKFETVNEAVATYIRNLNSHPVYEPLRLNRYDARLNNRKPAGYDMAIGLQKYSAKGMEYVEIIRAMIDKNKEYIH